MRELGLEVLDNFAERDIENSVALQNFIYLPDVAEIIPSSVFYGFTLIPETTNNDADSTPNIIYLLQFVNWSIYFYNELKTSYDAIASHPSKDMLSSEKVTSYVLADMIDQLSDNKKMTKVTHEQIENDARNRLRKNHAILKPAKFLQLCRFFARAWFDERFGVEKSTKFAHYISCYIENNPSQTIQHKCNYYKANSRNKEEVDVLFRDEEQKIVDMLEAKGKPLETIAQHEIKVSYTLNGFAILLVKTYNTKMLATYTISIEQIGIEDIFYLYARLHLSRYDKQKFYTRTTKKP